MAAYLLCTGELAEHPYRIEETGLSVWSAEELCYYIVHNPALLYEGFLTDGLIEFIADELKLPESADRIRRFRDSQVDFIVKIITVLREFRYYTEEEIGEFQTVLEERRKLPSEARNLERADALFHRQRYQSAIEAYQEILSAKNPREEICLTACNHMAAAYARLYLFEEALDSLMKSWDLREDSDTLMLILELCSYAELEIPSEIREAADDEKTVKAAEHLKEGARLAELHAAAGRTAAIGTRDSIRRNEGLSEYCAELRRQYRIMEN